MMNLKDCVHCGIPVWVNDEVPLCAVCGAPVKGDKIRQDWLRNHVEAMQSADMTELKKIYKACLSRMRTQVNFREDWEMLFAYEAVLRPFGLSN